VSHQTLAGKIDTLAVIVEYPANDLSALEPKWTRLLNQLGPLLQLDLFRRLYEDIVEAIAELNAMIATTTRELDDLEARWVV
jgi:hypothetical protein